MLSRTVHFTLAAAATAVFIHPTGAAADVNVDAPVGDHMVVQASRVAHHLTLQIQQARQNGVFWTARGNFGWSDSLIRIFARNKRRHHTTSRGAL